MSKQETIAGLISSSSVCSERELASEAYDAGYRAAIEDSAKVAAEESSRWSEVPKYACEKVAAEIRKLGAEE